MVLFTDQAICLFNSKLKKTQSGALIYTVVFMGTNTFINAFSIHQAVHTMLCIAIVATHPFLIHQWNSVEAILEISFVSTASRSPRYSE